jgi:hypothetical protein
MVKSLGGSKGHGLNRSRRKPGRTDVEKWGETHRETTSAADFVETGVSLIFPAVEVFILFY